MRRMDVVVLGRYLGTASGWDQMTDWIVGFYDFEPGTGVDLPSGFMQIDLENTGNIEFVDDEGNVTQTFDAVEILPKCKKFEA